MQAGLSASRHQLGSGWQQAFLTAPVWRFWLGAAICGTTVTGAIMPSLDGVGRYYPLTLHAVTGEAVSLPPPSIDPQDEWFAQVEAFLLATLDRAATFEQISDSAGSSRAAATAGIALRWIRRDRIGRYGGGSAFRRRRVCSVVHRACCRKSADPCRCQFLVDRGRGRLSVNGAGLARIAGSFSLFHTADRQSQPYSIRNRVTRDGASPILVRCW